MVRFENVIKKGKGGKKGYEVECVEGLGGVFF